MPHHRKRKRRRQDKPAISARLVLDDHVKGDVGILSEDLFADLFPTIAQGLIRFLHRVTIIVNELSFQPKQTATPLQILPKCTTSQYPLGVPLTPSKTQHGLLYLSEPRALWHIRLYNSLPPPLLSKALPRPFKRYPLRNCRATAGVALKSGY